MSNTTSGVAVDGGRTFWSGSTGRWAGEQMLKALAAGLPLSPSALRTLDTLRKDEWIHLDEALIAEGVIRLKGVADLIAAGNVVNIPNSMGKTIFQYEKVTDLGEAQVSLDGMAKSEADRQEFQLNNIPLPITHKDFFINLRTLTASRERGESLDTLQARTAGRVVMERLESMLFNGGPQFGGVPIYGYFTHPDRNILQFGTAGELWSAAGHSGEDILADVLAMITALEADRFFGPYWLYVPTGFSVKLEDDFKANSDKTIRQRLLEINRLVSVMVADQMPANQVVMVQGTPDVCAMAMGESLQTIQWDIEGGFQINFKAFTIQVPLVRSTEQRRCGIVVQNATGT
jgi:hypothetical protein